MQRVKWIQGTWAGIDYLKPFIQNDNPPKCVITRTSGENFGQLMGEHVLATIIFWERNYFQVLENLQLTNIYVITLMNKVIIVQYYFITTTTETIVFSNFRQKQINT